MNKGSLYYAQAMSRILSALIVDGVVMVRQHVSEEGEFINEVIEAKDLFIMDSYPEVFTMKDMVLDPEPVPACEHVSPAKPSQYWGSPPKTTIRSAPRQSFRQSMRSVNRNR